MALTVSKFDRSLGYMMAVETDSTNSINTDVFAGDGKLYSVDVDNTSGSNTCYVKLYITGYSPTLGSSTPDIILRCPASTRQVWTVPEGVDFTTLSFASTRNPAFSDTTATAGTLAVRIVASTEAIAQKTYSPLIALTTD